MNARIIPLLLVFALGCGKKDARTDGGLVEGPAPVTEPARPVHEDPGPALKRETGSRAPLIRATTVAQADRVQKFDGYSIVTVPLGSNGLRSNGAGASLTVDAGAQHAVAFGWSGADLKDPTRSVAGIIVRIVGSPPAKFSVRYAEVDAMSWGAARRGGVVGTIEVSVDPKLPAAKNLDTVFWDQAANWFAARGRQPFMQYAEQRARYLARGAVAAKPGPDGQRRRTDIEQMMELYSGMTSVNEALQADRGLLVRAEDVSERTIPISDIEALSLPEHPWARMIEQLDTKPSIEPLAASIPADMAYLHFGDLRTFVQVLHDLDEWVSPFAQWIEERGGASHFMSRYEEQLILERSGVAEKLGNIAAKQVAVVVSDPFLREGTDLSMVFRVANRQTLAAALGVFEARARSKHADMKRASFQVDGIQVNHLSTPNGAVNQYRAEYGELLVISNSEGAIRHLISAHKGAVPRLSEQGDFAYMRAKYPWSNEAEDGFVFLSDAFVARVVSPVLKIAEARRLDARADLAAVNYASLLRGWVDGKPAASGKELVAAGYMTSAELAHIDKQAITYTTAGGARSAYGDVTRLRPIRDLQSDVVKVSQREADAYGRFRQTYQAYWRGYLDPIGVRIRRDAESNAFEFDARMLPLIDVSEYDELIEQIGEQKIFAPADGPGVQWTLAIGKKAKLRATLNGLARGFIPGDNISIDWLGDWVSVGAADRGGLWDMGLVTGMVPTLDDESRDVLRGLEVLNTFPVYAAVHVANRMGLAALLTGLRAWVNDAAPGMISWGQTEPYRDIPIVSITEASGAPRELRGATIHYATVDDVFVIAFNHATLLTMIDRCLDGAMPRSPTGPPSQAEPIDTQTVFNFDPTAAGWITTTLLGIAESGLIGSHHRVITDYDLLWRGTGAGAALSAEAVRQLGVTHLGYEPRSPHGGTFSVVDGFVTHSIYGDTVRPRMPEVPVPNSPLTDVLRRIGRLHMALEVDGANEHRGLHTTFGWAWQ